MSWIIEGQQNPEDSDVKSESFLDEDNVIIVVEEILEEPKGDAPLVDESNFRYDSFVTGNQYAMGDYKISILSEEGQVLNQAIIDQRDMQAENFRHKIKYYDRFSDGYIELAEALLDPLGKQTYFIKGSTYDYNKNSNLELFVLERGFSLDNLQAVPNYIFSPMEFTLGRALLDDAKLTGKHAGDLRVYSSHHRIFDDSDLKSKTLDSLSEQNSDIIDQLLLASVEPFPEPELYALTTPLSSPLLSEPLELADPTPGPPTLPNLFDEIDFTAPKFEDAGRVRLTVETSSDVVSSQLQQPSILTSTLQDFNRLYVTLLLISLTAGLVAFGYAMWHKTRQRHVTGIDNLEPLLPTSTLSVISRARKPLDYKNNAHELISDAQNLHNKGFYKEAYVMLGQAIRLFYTYRLNLQPQSLLTNEELLEHMQKRILVSSEEYTSVKKWLVACGSVEYAKYKSDTETFTNILDAFSNVVVNGSLENTVGGRFLRDGQRGDDGV